MRCLVSVPPVLRGEAFVDSDSSGLQHRLIRSWIEAGFKPVSVNTSSELSRFPGHRDHLLKAGVDVLEVPPTSGDYPSYLPNLRASILLAAERFPAEVIALTNADIHFRLNNSCFHSLQKLTHADFLVAHRLDVKDDALFDVSFDGSEHIGLARSFLPGIDFIAAQADTLREACTYLSPHLTIGLPWWDLLLPISLYAAGANRSFLESSCFLHVLHEERWDPVWLSKVGILATRFLHRQIEAYKAPASAYVWSLAYSSIVSPVQSLRVYKSRLLTRIDQLRRGDFSPTYLLEILRMTEALVCRPGWELDERWISHWYPDGRKTVSD